MCLLEAMGMSQGPEIFLLGSIEDKKPNSVVAQPIQGDQDQVSVPQVPLKDHGDVLRLLRTRNFSEPRRPFSITSILAAVGPNIVLLHCR